MKKIIFRIFVTLFVISVSSILYLSTLGIKTSKFNNIISNQVREIDKNLELKFDKMILILDPFNLQVKTKIVGADIIYKDKIIKLENIKSNISIRSLLNNKFSLQNLSISTQSLQIKNLISILRLFKNNPKIYIAERFIKEGYIIADINIEFEDTGKIKDNFKIKGFLKDGKINFLKKNNFSNIDLIFNINKNNFNFNDINFRFNKKIFYMSELILNNKDNKFYVEGDINNEKTEFDDNFIFNFLKIDNPNFKVKKIQFDSKNSFSFSINQKFKIENLKINSNINLIQLIFLNKLNLKSILPDMKKDIIFKDNKIQIKYDKDLLNVNGYGNILLQNESDIVQYNILKSNNDINFDTTLNIKNNSFKLDFLNYQNQNNSDLEIKVNGQKQIRKNLLLKKMTIKEGKNIFETENIYLTDNYKIDDIEKMFFNYKDKENLQNSFSILNNKKDYILKGNVINLNKIVENLLKSKNKKNKKLFTKDFNLKIDLKKSYLDKTNIIEDLKGFLLYKDNDIEEANLKSKFLNGKKINLTIKKNNNEKITTLFSNEASPLVKRYKFIKGFDEGTLDYYSVKKKDIDKSILKIYDFKLKKLPVLTKVLTLASLQGIADLLSGEGIRFNELEMDFTNQDKLITINEIYAIGPAISILMSGYIEKDKLISLRGTLVPATTLNKTIGSIPLLGDILVGKKTGEGVFGVSFKIKGPPKNLETTVNPIKTLTPRFITRTLEKIKKD